MKQILFLILSAFLLISCVSGSSKQAGTSNPAAERAADHSTEQTVTPADPLVVYVYYFHGSQRCKTCVAVEKAARESVAAIYGEQEQVRFVEVPTDDAANKGLWNSMVSPGTHSSLRRVMTTSTSRRRRLPTGRGERDVAGRD